MLLLGVKLCKGGERPCNSLFVSVSVSMCMSMSISVSIQRQERGENGEYAKIYFSTSSLHRSSHGLTITTLLVGLERKYRAAVSGPDKAQNIADVPYTTTPSICAATPQYHSLELCSLDRIIMVVQRNVQPREIEICHRAEPGRRLR